MTRPLILAPDAEALCIGWISGQLTLASSTAVIRKRIPNPRPPWFATVQRVGGPMRSEFVDQPTLAFEAWAKAGPSADEMAHDLARLIRGWVFQMAGRVIGGTQVYLVQETAGPAFLPDPDSNDSRYVWTASIAVRAAQAG